MAITDRVHVQHHASICAQLGTRFPKRAFSGATLDLLFTGELDQLDASTRERVLDFATAFLDCDCEANPYCGHPERKFIRYLLELRAEGHSPEAIVELMTADYMVSAYPGDVLSFLDDAVRTLEAAEALAAVDGASAAEERLAAARRSLL